MSSTYYSRARPGSKEPNLHMSVGHEHDVMTDLPGSSIIHVPSGLSSHMITPATAH